MKYKFLKGSKAIITDSSENWNPKMDKFIGREVIILNNTNNSIRFEDDGNWDWSYLDGHFKLAELNYEIY